MFVDVSVNVFAPASDRPSAAGMEVGQSRLKSGRRLMEISDKSESESRSVCISKQSMTGLTVVLHL